MFEVFFNKNVTFVFFLIVLSVLLVKSLKAEGLSEEAVEGLVTEESADEEVNLLQPTIEITLSPTPEISFNQNEENKSTEYSGYIFLVQDDENLVRVNRERENDALVLSSVSQEAGFLRFSISPTANFIVFSKGQDEQQDIFIMDINEGELRNLTENNIQNRSPRFSPDGNRIAFSNFTDQSYDISIVDLEGELLNYFDTNLCHTELAWLDNDNLLIIECKKEYDISILNIDTGEISTLIDELGEELAPDTRPDGKYLTFTCRRTLEEDFEICVMDILSKEIVYLTDNNEDEWSPSWSADGSLIVYSTDQGVFAMDVNGNNNEYLYSSALGNSSAIYWNILQGQISSKMDTSSTSEPEGSSPFLEMENRECCECHTMVPQTHMERSIIITEYECQNCHLNLFQVHSEVSEPLIAGP